MGIDEERLKQIYESWKTEDLIKAITVDKTKYEPFAIDLMSREIQKRNVKKEEIVNFERNLLEKEERLCITGMPFCPNCHSNNLREVLRLWGFRDWFERSILGRLFSLSIPQYECLECGYNFTKNKENT
jgi:transposase-like protein